LEAAANLEKTAAGNQNAVNRDDAAVRRATAPATHDLGADGEGNAAPAGDAGGASPRAVSKPTGRGDGNRSTSGAALSAGSSDGVTAEASPPATPVRPPLRCPCSPPFPRSTSTLTEMKAALSAAGEMSPTRFCSVRTINEHRRAERWTALLFLRTPKPKELQQLRALSAPKCHRHRRFCEMALPIICLSACELPSCSKGPLCLPFQ